MHAKKRVPALWSLLVGESWSSSAARLRHCWSSRTTPTPGCRFACAMTVAGHASATREARRRRCLVSANRLTHRPARNGRGAPSANGQLSSASSAQPSQLSQLSAAWNLVKGLAASVICEQDRRIGGGGDGVSPPSPSRRSARAGAFRSKLPGSGRAHIT
jgi:hypothetical protein